MRSIRRPLARYRSFAGVSTLVAILEESTFQNGGNPNRSQTQE